MSALEQQFAADGVAHAYRHAAKVAAPQPSLMLGDALLKWYDIAPQDSPVPLAIRALARRCLRDARKSGTLGIEEGLGFVILHRCGADFYFLLVSTWRNENELWETVWAKCGPADVFFHPWESAGTHRPTFCVWELGAVAHEREAWTRFLTSARDDAARRAYLRDLYAGAV
ncbi:MAG TPA: hypothetical protein VIT46_06165 [Gaiellaceae bacterium]